MKTLSLATAFIMLLCSCGKDDTPATNNNNGQITGTWTFINIYLHNFYQFGNNQSTTVYTFNDVSVNNQGELMIDSGKIEYRSIVYTAYPFSTQSFSLGTVVVVPDSTSNILMDTVHLPNISAPYKMIGSDSLFQGATDNTAATGYSVAWDGDTLILGTKASMTTDTSYRYKETLMRFIKKK